VWLVPPEDVRRPFTQTDSPKQSRPPLASPPLPSSSLKVNGNDCDNKKDGKGDDDNDDTKRRHDGEAEKSNGERNNDESTSLPLVLPPLSTLPSSASPRQLSTNTPLQVGAGIVSTAAAAAAAAAARQRLVSWTGDESCWWPLGLAFVVEEGGASSNGRVGGVGARRASCVGLRPQRQPAPRVRESGGSGAGRRQPRLAGGDSVQRWWWGWGYERGRAASVGQGRRQNGEFVHGWGAGSDKQRQQSSGGWSRGRGLVGGNNGPQWRPR